MKKFTLLLSLLLASFAGFSQVNCTTVTVSVTGGSFPNEIQWDILDSNGNSVLNFPGIGVAAYALCLPDGCYSVVMIDTFGDGWNGANMTIASNGVVLLTATFNSGNYSSAAFGINAEGCSPADVAGCTDPTAINYNPNATVDDGSCTFYNGGGGNGCNSSNCEGTCANFYLCTFSNGNQVAIEITDSNGGVVFTQSGFNNGQVMNTTLCLEPGECYYVNMWNNQGLNGWYNGYFWINVNGVQIINESLNTNLSQENTVFSIGAGCPLAGCTDPEALNYNPNATDDDGSCTYPEPCSGAQVAVTYTPGAFAAESSWQIVAADGSVQASGGGSNSNASTTQFICLADGCYTLLMNDSFGDGWNGATITGVGGGIIYFNATLPSGNSGAVSFGINTDCEEIEWIYGCTDPSALNYNPAANMDDGSCNYGNDIYGCTDPAALNYNFYATIDDGSCYYEQGDCITPPDSIDVNSDAYAYVISIDPFCCNTAWDSLCQSQFDNYSNMGGNCDISFEVIPSETGENVLYVVLNFTGEGELSFLWDFGNGDFSEEQFPTYIYPEDGTYTLCVAIYSVLAYPSGTLECYDTYCAEITSDVFNGMGLHASSIREGGFTINVVGQDWLSVNEQPNVVAVGVFPNPFNDSFQVVVDGSVKGNVQMDLFDLNGRLVKSETKANAQNMTLDASNLPVGMYMLNVHTNEGVSRHRLIKQ